MEVCYLSMSPEGVLQPCTADEAQQLMTDEDALVVAKTDIGGGLVSTVFLPICMTFEDGSPQAFETVVVRGHKTHVRKRYSDLADALQGHDEIAASI